VLQSGFAGAASQLAAIHPTPFARPAHAVLVAAVRRAANAYGALGAATRGGNYDAAAKRVDAAEKNVDAAVSRLENIKLP